MTAKHKPFVNIGPGQIIKRNLDALNWTNKDLAEIIGMSEKSISQMMNNKQSITVETAILLSKAFKTSPEFWLNLEQNYRLRSKKESQKEKETEIKAEIRKYMPVLEMKKKKWIDCGKTAESQVKAYNDFWGQRNTDFSVYQHNKLPFCARQSKNDENFTTYYSITWFQKAKCEARKIKAVPYSKEKLQILAGKISEYTLLSDGVNLFINELYRCGVKFFILSHLSKTFLDGASFFDNKNPVIVYTSRYNRVDNFWWTIAHEIAHILLHLKDENDCFLDNLDDKTSTSVKEKEADRFTSKLFFVDQILNKAEPYKNYFTESRLKEIAGSLNLDCSVVLGILQHNGTIDFRTLPGYRKTVLNLISDQFKCG